MCACKTTRSGQSNRTNSITPPQHKSNDNMETHTAIPIFRTRDSRCHSSVDMLSMMVSCDNNSGSCASSSLSSDNAPGQQNIHTPHQTTKGPPQDRQVTREDKNLHRRRRSRRSPSPLLPLPLLPPPVQRPSLPPRSAPVHIVIVIIIQRERRQRTASSCPRAYRRRRRSRARKGEAVHRRRSPAGPPGAAAPEEGGRRTHNVCPLRAREKW